MQTIKKNIIIDYCLNQRPNDENCNICLGFNKIVLKNKKITDECDYCCLDDVDNINKILPSFIVDDSKKCKNSLNDIKYINYCKKKTYWFKKIKNC